MKQLAISLGTVVQRGTTPEDDPPDDLPEDDAAEHGPAQHHGDQ
jgi:hypothetical protein